MPWLVHADLCSLRLPRQNPARRTERIRLPWWSHSMLVGLSCTLHCAWAVWCTCRRDTVKTGNECIDTGSIAPDCEMCLAATLDRFAMLDLAAPLPGTLGLAAWRPATVVLWSCLRRSGALSMQSFTEASMPRIQGTVHGSLRSSSRMRRRHAALLVAECRSLSARLIETRRSSRRALHIMQLSIQPDSLIEVRSLHPAPVGDLAQHACPRRQALHQR